MEVPARSDSEGPAVLCMLHKSQLLSEKRCPHWEDTPFIPWVLGASSK